MRYTYGHAQSAPWLGFSYPIQHLVVQTCACAESKSLPAQCPLVLCSCAKLRQRPSWSTRLQGSPNNVKETLDNVIAWLDDPKTQDKVQQLASEFCEYVADM